MDILNDLPLAVALPALALLDGLSVGTLLIPLFLLLLPGQPAVGRILLYLGTITVFYAVIGVLVSLGFVTGWGWGGEFLSSPSGAVLRLVVGAALLVVAFCLPGGRRPAPTRVTETAGSVSGPAPTPPVDVTIAAGSRLARWRERLLAPGVAPVAVVSVALAAGLIEVATMLPYLAAMGLLSVSDVAAPVRLLVIVGYCLVMIAPALVLLALRVVARERVETALRRLAAWVYRLSSGETAAWLLGIIGFLIARAAAIELDLFAAVGRLFSGSS